MMRLILERLEELPQWQRTRERMVIAHGFGDTNLLADAFSRGYFETARQLCAQLGMAYEQRPHGPQLAPLVGPHWPLVPGMLSLRPQ